MPELHTDRLILRPFTGSDGPTVERLAGAREVADTTLTIPHPYPAGGGVEWIATLAPSWDRRELLTLAICAHTSPSDVMGTMSIRLTMAHLYGEIGYWIAVGEWGKGYATEAARAVAAFGFSELGLHRLQGRHLTRNAASGRVMQKLGMRLEGVHRHAYCRWGQFEDVAMYAVLAPEWSATDFTPIGP